MPAGRSIVIGGTTLNVPDYVFDKNYQLMPLEELQAFIETNKHLPEIPSGKDVGSNGLDMIAMQLKLLQKVEELTLYTLKQQETIDSLNGRLAELDAGTRQQ